MDSELSTNARGQVAQPLASDFTGYSTIGIVWNEKPSLRTQAKED